MSVYEFLFVLKDDEVDLFYQSCVADDLGNFIEDPFADKSIKGKLEVDEPAPIPELGEKPEDIDI